MNVGKTVVDVGRVLVALSTDSARGLTKQNNSLIPLPRSRQIS